LAAVLYDRGTSADLSEEEKRASIHPLQQKRDELIKGAIESHLDQVIITIKNIEEDASNESRKAQRHLEKAQEAKEHAHHIREALKTHMLAHMQTERIQGNYMATIVDSKLEVR
jgi:hypothetical protein